MLQKFLHLNDQFSAPEMLYAQLAYKEAHRYVQIAVDPAYNIILLRWPLAAAINYSLDKQLISPQSPANSSPL